MTKKRVGDDDLVYDILSAEDVVDNLPADGSSQDTRFCTSRGYIVTTKAVDKFLIKAIQEQYEDTRPKPPRVFIESKGREEENPDDDRFVAAMKRWNGELGMAVATVFMLKGIDVVGYPSNAITQDNPEWLEELETMGIKVKSKSKARLLWIQTVVTDAESSDLDIILRSISAKTGVSEEGVASEMESTFQN